MDERCGEVRRDCSDAAAMNVICSVCPFHVFTPISLSLFVINVIHVNSHSMHLMEGPNKVMD